MSRNYNFLNDIRIALYEYNFSGDLAKGLYDHAAIPVSTVPILTKYDTEIIFDYDEMFKVFTELQKKIPTNLWIFRLFPLSCTLISNFRSNVKRKLCH